MKSAFRPFPAAVMIAVVSLAPCGCKRSRPVPVQVTEEEPPQLASIVHVADPRVSSQLVSGFYNVEQNSWRWTAGRFAVVLRPPTTSPKRGATLQLKLVVPDAVLEKVKAISLGAELEGKRLPRESYTQAGEFTYTREVPPELLQKPAVKITFDLDKFLPAGSVEARELGIIVTSIGFELK